MDVLCVTAAFLIVKPDNEDKSYRTKRHQEKPDSSTPHIVTGEKEIRFLFQNTTIKFCLFLMEKAE